MNYIYQQQRLKNDQQRALAIAADHPDITRTTFQNIWIAIVVLMVRALTAPGLPHHRTNDPHRKLKMQLLAVYSLPALFIFGASGIILVVMYLCIFGLMLTLIKKTTD